MVKTAERNNLTYAYATHTYSGAIVDVPVFSRNSSISSCEPPSTTATIGFLTRDPISYEGSDWNLYEYCHSRSLNGFDPFGEDDSSGGSGPPNFGVPPGPDHPMSWWPRKKPPRRPAVAPAPWYPPPLFPTPTAPQTTPIPPTPDPPIGVPSKRVKCGCSCNGGGSIRQLVVETEDNGDPVSACQRACFDASFVQPGGPAVTYGCRVVGPFPPVQFRCGHIGGAIEPIDSGFSPLDCSVRECARTCGNNYTMCNVACGSCFIFGPTPAAAACGIACAALCNNESKNCNYNCSFCKKP